MATGITHLVLRILHSILSNELKLNQLQQFVGIRDAVESFTEIFQGLLVVDGHESGESISFASVVVLGTEEGLNEFWSIGDQGFGVLVDRRHSPHSILSHISVAVLEARASGREERLDEFRLAKFAEEAEGISSDVFIRVLQVVSNTIAAELLAGKEQPAAEGGLTKPRSFLASICRWSPVLGISRSKSREASSETCSSKA